MWPEPIGLGGWVCIQAAACKCGASLMPPSVGCNQLSPSKPAAAPLMMRELLSVGNASLIAHLHGRLVIGCLGNRRDRHAAWMPHRPADRMLQAV